MSEEEIIKYIKEEIENETDTFHWFDNTPNNTTRKQLEESIQAHQGLLDLYNKEKEERQKFEKDLFENCSNYVISKAKIKEKVEEKISICHCEQLEDRGGGDEHEKYWSLFEHLLKKLLKELLEE